MRLLLRGAAGVLDDVGALLMGREIMALNVSQAARAAGTNRIHAGSIGGQLATLAAKVP